MMFKPGNTAWIQVDSCMCGSIIMLRKTSSAFARRGAVSSQQLKCLVRSGKDMIKN